MDQEEACWICGGETRFDLGGSGRIYCTTCDKERPSEEAVDVKSKIFPPDYSKACQACGRVYHSSDNFHEDHKIPQAFYKEVDAVGRNFCSTTLYEKKPILEHCKSLKNAWTLCKACHQEKTDWDNLVFSKLRNGTMTCEYALFAFRENCRELLKRRWKNENPKN